MSDSWCRTCGDFTLFPEAHRCPPWWLVHCPEWGGDDPASASRVRAHDAEEAAEKWAEESDDEHDLIDSDMTVRVRLADDDSAPWESFTVSAEAVVEYTATAFEDAQGQEVNER